MRLNRSQTRRALRALDTLTHRGTTRGQKIDAVVALGLVLLSAATR